MILIILGLVMALSAQAAERITLFKSDITVNPDSTLTVCELIEVHATGDQIRRGIVREFPTQYSDRWGNSVNVQFHLTHVQRDDIDEPYHITEVSNGKKLYIGDRDTLLASGDYTYTICYRTNRQIGFFQDHDELYFNVTGNGWRLPIDKAIAEIHLPSSIPINKVMFELYTGYQEEQGHEAIGTIKPDGTIVFATTQPLNRYQGLTIILGWPKEYIIKPSFWQEIRWFFQDNLSILIALIGLLLVFLYFFRLWRRVKRFHASKPTIALFYPPENMAPGGVRYLCTMKYDAIAFAADVVALAVEGCLTIEQEKRLSWNYSYLLHKKNQPQNNSLYSALFNQLFASSDKVMVGKQNRLIAAIYEQQETAYKTRYSNLFDNNNGAIAVGYFMVAATVLATIFLSYQSPTIFSWLIIALMILVAFIFTWLSRSYTPEGLEIKRAIDGFKLFLEATEKDRFEIIGTPPTRTPELYEKYLPFAIALGVEKQWSKQFAPLFETLARQGHPHVMVWYSGGFFDSFSPSSFSSTIGNTMSNAVSSSGFKPGSSSGFGGRGSSGGGGGGGGGGGW